MTDVIIVGAGLGGLSVARRLRDRGIAVLVLEASDEVGGLCRSENVNGFLCDEGFHVVNMARLRRLLPALSSPTVALPDGIIATASEAERRVHGGREEGEPPYLDEWFNGAVEPERTWLSVNDRRWRSSQVPLSWAPGHGTMGADSFKGAVVDPLYASVTWDLSGRAGFTSSNATAQDWLLQGSLFIDGISSLAKFLAHGVDVHTGSRVLSLDGGSNPWVRTERGEFRAFAIVVAAGSATFSLVGRESPFMLQYATSFWFAAGYKPSESSRIHLGVATFGRVLHSIVISNAVPTRAPAGWLVEATVLRRPGMEIDVASVLDDLSKMFEVPTKDWHLLRRYDMSAVRSLVPAISVPVSSSPTPGLHVLDSRPGHADVIANGFALADQVAREVRRRRRPWSRA